MPEPWGADVHSDLRVYFDADGKARFSASCPSANVVLLLVLYDVQAKIAELRSRAEALDAWMQAWSRQEDA